jgi:hypothetical protein
VVGCCERGDEPSDSLKARYLVGLSSRAKMAFAPSSKSYIHASSGIRTPSLSA